MFQLKEPPNDLSNYTEAPEFGSIKKNHEALQVLIKEAKANIIAKECSLASINDLEALLAENQYKVFFMQLDDSTSFADFYLRKF
jgi:hypothetical protein